MWAVEGLTHRYPTKVLAELLSTCPQYCGHCTRMDLVGNNVPQVIKHRFEMKQKDRYEAMLEYLRETPSRPRRGGLRRRHRQPARSRTLEQFVGSLLDIENIRDIRLATKGLMGIPQHFLQDEVLAGHGAAGQEGRRARRRPRGSHARQPRQLGDAAGGQGRARSCSTWASATCATRASCCAG